MISADPSRLGMYHFLTYLGVCDQCEVLGPRVFEIQLDRFPQDAHCFRPRFAKARTSTFKHCAT